jgi:hypothetical protein
MGVRCDCGKVWSTGESTEGHRCDDYERRRVPGHTISGEPSWSILINAVVFAVRVVHQRLRLAWLRMWAKTRRSVETSDPYRALGPAPRFELHVGEDVLESDSFASIIVQMRALGCSDAEVIDAAIVTHRTPRGGKVRINHMQRVNETLSLLAGPAHEGAFARRLRERDSSSASTPRGYLD